MTQDDFDAAMAAVLGERLPNGQRRFPEAVVQNTLPMFFLRMATSLPIEKISDELREAIVVSFGIIGIDPSGPVEASAPAIESYIHQHQPSRELIDAIEAALSRILDAVDNEAIAAAEKLSGKPTAKPQMVGEKPPAGSFKGASLAPKRRI